MTWTVSRTERSWLELAHMLRTEWEGGPLDRQRALDLAAELSPASPDMRHTLAHLTQRLALPRH